MRVMKDVEFKRYRCYGSCKDTHDYMYTAVQVYSDMYVISHITTRLVRQYCCTAT